MEVKDEEVKGEKYLSKEQKEKLERERQKEEEIRRALMADDAGRRA